MLRRGEHDLPTELIERDFWVIDDNRVVVMHYDDLGRFEAGEVLPDDELEPHLTARDAAWSAAESFGRWWARHPELHGQLTS